MNQQVSIDSFLSAKTFALAGASRSGKKFGNIVLKTLTKKGYHILPVHPGADQINDKTCFSSIAKLPSTVENLILIVPPDQTEQVVQEIFTSGIKRVWMQQGSESSIAIEFCKKNNIDLVSGECILMYADPRGLHKFHRWIWELLGKKTKQ
jgi:hypothetical protein